MLKQVVFLTGLLVFLPKVQSYFVTIDAHSEECFYERIEETGIKVGMDLEKK